MGTHATQTSKSWSRLQFVLHKYVSNTLNGQSTFNFRKDSCGTSDGLFDAST